MEKIFTNNTTYYINNLLISWILFVNKHFFSAFSHTKDIFSHTIMYEILILESTIINIFFQNFFSFVLVMLYNEQLNVFEKSINGK